MKKLLITTFCLLTSLQALADFEKFKFISVSELEKWMKSTMSDVYILDANNEETRKSEGLIPGAKTLSSHNKYSVTKELPEDKNAKLIFYCANTQCIASHNAAERAAEAGYKEVYVLGDGIKGWKKAGKPSIPYKKS